jgi:hypothetical protein
MRENKIALGCPTNAFLNFLGILYPPNFGHLEGTGVFQHLQAIALKTRNECNGDVEQSARILPVWITVLQRYGSHRSTHGEKGDYKSPVSEDGDIGQHANCTRDLAACAERKNADANADDPDRCQEPHARQKTRKIWHIVRVRKDSAGRANKGSDSGCYGY